MLCSTSQPYLYTSPIIVTAVYKIENEESVDSPALLVYPHLVKKNISSAIELAGSASALRPHVKTHKSTEVTRLLLDAGLTKFKCATIAEAEMLATAGAKDILLAYQPTVIKAKRLLTLSRTYADVLFSCVVDNEKTVRELSEIFKDQMLPVYIDLNVGMNRTGVLPENAYPVFQACQWAENIHIAGLHAYEGHIHHTDSTIRKKEADEAWELASAVKEKLQKELSYPLKVVIGGTPTFHLYGHHQEVELSPGTFVFWDEGYRSLLPDLPFIVAAVVVTRVISKIDDCTVCIDLGHKSIASENPFPRIHFLGMEAEGLSHSEEHMVVSVPDADKHFIGEVWYGIPYHICPTVALYDSVYVVENQRVEATWKVVARDRAITI